MPEHERPQTACDGAQSSDRWGPNTPPPGITDLTALGARQRTRDTALRV